MQQVDLPYGNAFIVNTPAIDQMSQRLGMEQRQRELMRQKQMQALDDEFSKNVTNIRDADVDEVTKKYGEWKLANQQAMKNKEGVSPKEQLELLRKKSEIYKTINASKVGLKEEQELREGLMKNPDQYDDNAATYLAVRRNTPLTGLSQYKDANGNAVDLSNYNTYKYKGTDTDFSKLERDAAGTPRQVFQEESPLDGGLQVKITPYMYGNTPQQFYQNYLGALSQRKAGRDAEALASQIRPEVFLKIQDEYKNIPVETWKKMGVDKPQELVITPEDSKAERLAKHQAQLYALNNQPKQGTPVFRDNKAAIDARNFEQQKQMQAIRQADAKELINLRQKLDKNDVAMQDVWIDTYIDKLGEESKKSSQMSAYYDGKGNRIVEDTIPIDAVLSKALEKQKVQPSELTITADGKYRPIYFKYNKNGERVPGKHGGYIVDEELSVPISRDQLKLSLGAKSVTPSQRTKEMLNGNEKDKSPSVKKFPLPKGKPKTVQQGGFTYTWDENSGEYK